MSENFKPVEDNELGVEPLQPWAAREKPPVPWIPDNVKFGQVVLPPNEQKSNAKLADEQVMARRDEPVGKSAAFPIRSGEDRSVDFSPTRKITPGK